MKNIKFVICAIAMFASSLGFAAETYKVYSAWPVGSSPDIITRKMLDVLQNNTGDAFAVINKPGGDGAVATNAFLADKTTPNKILATTVSAIVDMNQETREQVKSLVFFFKIDYLLISHADSNINTLDDVKGKINIGTMSYNKTGDMFLKHIVKNPDVQFINYPSDSELMSAMYRKEIQLANITDGNVFYKSSKDKYKVVTAYEMLKAAPGIGFMVSKDMASDTTTKLNGSFNTAIQDSEFKKWFIDVAGKSPAGGKPEVLDAATNSIKSVRDKQR